MMPIKALTFLRKIAKIKDPVKQAQWAEAAKPRSRSSVWSLEKESEDNDQDSNNTVTLEWHLVIKLLDKLLFFVYASLFIVLTVVFAYKCYS